MRKGLYLDFSCAAVITYTGDVREDGRLLASREGDRGSLIPYSPRAVRRDWKIIE